MEADKRSENPPGVKAIEDRPSDEPLRRLHDSIRVLLHRNRAQISYHGWPHCRFVTRYAIEFAREYSLDEDLVGSAALVHDLNYLVRPNSDPLAGEHLIVRELHTAGYGRTHTAAALRIIDEAYLATRGPHISAPAACLSDADSLFKALPITPLLLARSYLYENGVSLRDLATKIVREQQPLLDSGHYFYLASVRARYEDWARQNVLVWRRALEALGDDEVSWLADQLLEVDAGVNLVQ